MQARARRTNVANEGALHGHVDVLVVHVPLKRTGVNLALNLQQASLDLLRVLLRDDTLSGKHLRVRDGSGDVLRVHALVVLERRAKLLRELAHSLLKAA